MLKIQLHVRASFRFRVIFENLRLKRRNEYLGKSGHNRRLQLPSHIMHAKDAHLRRRAHGLKIIVEEIKIVRASVQSIGKDKFLNLSASCETQTILGGSALAITRCPTSSSLL